MKIKNTIISILTKIGKYTHTDMLYIGKSGFWLTVGQLFTSLFVLLTTIAFANLLPKEIYGTYKYILSIGSLLLISTLSGMGMSLIQSISRGKEGSLTEGIKKQIQWGSLGMLGGLLLSLYYFFNHNTILATSLLIVGLFIPFFNNFATVSSLFIGRKLFKEESSYTIITQLVNATAVIITLFFTNNIFFLLFAYYFSYTSIRFLLFKIILRKYKPNEEEDPETIKYGFHLSFINIITTISAKIDSILLFHFLGATQLAIYLFAVAVPEQIKSLFKSINLLSLPKFSNRTKEQINEKIDRKLISYILVLIPVLAAYIFAAPFIYKYIFPQYMESIAYSTVYATVMLANPTALILSVFQSQKMSATIYRLRIINGSTKIVLLPILIFFYGIWGAIATQLICQFSNFGFHYYYLKFKK